MNQQSLALEAEFVDRDKEQATLRGLFQQTLGGRGNVVFVAGEAGVGKTRLAKEFSRYAESSGALFLVGSCYEHEGVLPYSPWIDVMRTLLKTTPANNMRKLQGWTIGEVGRLVPSILTQAERMGLKGWLQGPRYSSMTTPSTDQDRVRLFEAVMDLLSNSAAERPIVIFLDDVGWADQASLQLLHYVARHAVEHKLMVIAAYRDVELPDDHILSQMTLDLDRRKIAHRINMSRLNSEHLSQLLAAYLKAPVSSELGELVHSKTGGNPFFAEEIIRSLNDDGLLASSRHGWTLRDTEKIAIPTSIRAILRQRTGKLGDECVSLLSLASLIGMEFDFEVLKKVMGGADENTMKLLESATRSQLVREQREGSRVVYVFADEQVRNYLAEQVSLLRGRKYHRSIGQALEETYKDTIGDHAGQIAYHYLQSGDTAKAREYSMRAGERSAQLHAYSDAAKHLLKALELTAESDPEARLDLLTKLGRAEWVKANHEGVLQFCGEALKIAERLGDRNKIADLYSLMGVSHFILGSSSTQARESLLRGLRVLEDTGDSVQEAFLCSQLARVCSLTGQSEEARHWVDKAIEIATKLGAHDALSQSYQTLALLLPPREKGLIIEYCEKALQLAIEHGLEDSACRAYINLAAAYSLLKWSHRRAQELLIKGIAYAQNVGRIDDEAWMRGELILVHHDLGEWESCDREAPDVISLANEVGERNLLLPYLALGLIATARGNLQEAENILAKSFPIARRLGWTQLLSGCYHIEAEIHLAKEEFDQAERSLLSALENEKKEAWGDATIGTLQELVSLNSKKGNLEDAVGYYHEIQQRASEFDENWTRALERWANGLVEEMRQDAMSGVGALKESTNLFRILEQPYDLARALLDQARLQAKTGLKREAESSLEEAKNIFDRLGIAWRLSA